MVPGLSIVTYIFSFFKNLNNNKLVRHLLIVVLKILIAFVIKCALFKLQ